MRDTAAERSWPDPRNRLIWNKPKLGVSNEDFANRVHHSMSEEKKYVLSEEQKARFRENNRKRYHEKLKNDPEWCERFKEGMKRQKADPTYKERRKEINRRWREKLNAKKEEDPDLDAHLKSEYLRYARQEKARDPLKYKARHSKYSMQHVNKNGPRKIKEWRISDEEAMAIYIQNCHYCGKPSSKEKLNGIDRKDSNGHYEQGNMLPCCIKCNTAKGARPYDDFVQKMKSKGLFPLSQ